MDKRKPAIRPIAAVAVLGVALCLGCSGPGPEDRAPQPPLAPVDALTPAPSDDPCETAAAFVAAVKASLRAGLEALPESARRKALAAGRFDVAAAPAPGEPGVDPGSGEPGQGGRAAVALLPAAGAAPFFSADIALPAEEPPSLVTVELGGLARSRVSAEINSIGIYLRYGISS